MEVGITGGIGAGKSIVCKIFSTLGIPIYDADTRARQLMEESQSLRDNISAVFGDNSYNQEGALNREYLANLVFSDSIKVRELNRMVHPEVAKDYLAWVNIWSSQAPYLVKEAALLIESGSYLKLDYLVTVTAPIDLRITRVLSRDPQRERKQIESIIERQLSDPKRVEFSDFVLNNDEKQMLIPQVLQLHSKFIGLVS